MVKGRYFLSRTRFLFPLFFLCFIVVFSNAQDVHLSQFYTSNLSLNPALTGHYDGDMRAVLNARSQWSQLAKSFKTNMFSVEKKILRHSDEFGIGLIVVNDQLSEYFLSTNKLALSASYQREIKKNIFRIGAQAGVVMKNINFNGQTLPDQWNYSAGIYDPSIFSGETTLQNNWSYQDINAGFAWARRFKEIQLSAGYGLFHINRAKEKFSSYGENGVPMRHVINASATYYFSPIVWVTPNVLYMKMAKATDFVFVGNVHRRIRENVSLMIGAGYRGSVVNSDALILLAGATYSRFTLGLNTDFTVSSLRRNSSYKSAWEISLMYTTPSRKPGKITIPCHRY